MIHVPVYKEACELVPVGRYRQTGRIVELAPDAAAALKALMAAAAAAGTFLVPISGFRSLAYQSELFARAVVRHGSEAAAEGWVARPGNSEHHTGLAIDLGDEQTPEADTEQVFETTPAFRWLEKNAGRFGFELSYPANNPSGIQYEPWHWRFIGSHAAKALFRT